MDIVEDDLELTLDGIAQGGDGVGRVEGLVVFVRGGLPGERVRVRIVEQRTSYLRGELVEVLAASPDRIDPRIPASDHVPWQHIAYPAQLRFKEQIVRDQLYKLVRLADPPLAPILAAPQPWGYRNNARLHVVGDRIGYHAGGTNDLVALDEDPLLLPILNVALAGLRPLLAGFTPATGPLEAVTLRASSAFGYAAAALHPAPDADPAAVETIAAAWQSAVPALAGVGVARVNRGPLLHELFGDVVFSLGVESFFQANLPQAERMLALIRERLAPQGAEHALDIYSGAGAFALPLAASVAAVTAIEEHPGAVADGRRTAELNDIANVQFIRAAAERALERIDGPVDAAIVDPPRRGCHPAVLDALDRIGPPCLIYISCHPGILARDLRPLLTYGYTLEHIQPVDMFPQTPHIETVVVLRR
jgi:23S rRNA (uracil1939-C5)-methyltransferase